MSVVHSIPVSDELYYQISIRAERAGVSMQAWVSFVLERRLRVEGQAEEFFRRRSQGAGSVEEALTILNAANDAPPMPGDELPEDYALTPRT